MTLAAAASSAVAAWNLNETSGNRADQVGSNTLTDNNTVTSVAGVFGNAAYFTATNSESLSIVDNAALSGGDIDLMIRCWINLTSTGTRAVIGKWDWNGDLSDEYLLWLDSGSKLNWTVKGGGATHTAQTTAISTGTWYLVHVWHDATNDLIGISVNAGTAVTTSHSTGIDDSTHDFEMGMTDGSVYWDGAIDDVVFLRNRFLDATERTADYNSGTGVAFASWAGGGGGGGGGLLLKRRRAY